jgi:tRNA nucleotidyltransferase/poly(A) polymerase
MSDPLPASIPGDHEVLRRPGVRAVFAALNREGEEARIVGGAIRDILAGVPVGDIDFATTAPPMRTRELAEAAGIKVVPTGVDHGTLTLVAAGEPHEVTTLRTDVETDGRHAVVRFGRDWTADAMRRDFTVNALALDAGGKVHDPAGGIADIAARRIRFIGDPAARIAEDRLRILRFFRFHSTFGEGPPDPAGLSASIRARHGLARLSAERIGQEMKKLVLGRRAAETVESMEFAGILGLVTAGVAHLPEFARLVRTERPFCAAPSAPVRLAVLCGTLPEDALRIAERFRLSGAERGRMLAAQDAAMRLAKAMGDRGARRVLHRVGAAAFADGALVLAAQRSGEAARMEVIRDLPERAPVPAFPVAGRDALAAGIPAGPAVGAALAALENWWIDQDFAPDAGALKRRLQEMAHSGQ